MEGESRKEGKSDRERNRQRIKTKMKGGALVMWSR